MIFAKAPVPGRVKTRLIPALGARRAARLQARLTHDLIGRMVEGAVCPSELWASGARDPSFLALQARFGFPIRPQRGGDLGVRMELACRETLRSADAVVLVGTDCPLLTPDRIASALEMLGEVDVVLGPAEDGGYVLLALKRVDGSLFRGIPWGTERVAELTRRRLSGLGWTWHEQPPLWDLDRPEDLSRLGKDLPGYFRTLVSPLD